MTRREVTLFWNAYWELGRIRWYADQALYHTVTQADTQGNPWVFDHDFYLIINIAVGGHLSVPPDRSTTFPQAMLIDYIRIYSAPDSVAKQHRTEPGARRA